MSSKSFGLFEFFRRPETTAKRICSRSSAQPKQNLPFHASFFNLRASCSASFRPIKPQPNCPNVFGRRIKVKRNTAGTFRIAPKFRSIGEAGRMYVARRSNAGRLAALRHREHGRESVRLDASETQLCGMSFGNDAADRKTKPEAFELVA